jgi:hypothetical protein
MAAIRDWTALRTRGERKTRRSGPYGVVEIFSWSIAHSLQISLRRGKEDTKTKDI